MAHICGRVRAGESGGLFLSGEAGTGKTTLLDEARRLASPDVRVAAGCGHAMEADLPYGLTSQLFESLGRFGLIDLLPAGPAPSDMRGPGPGPGLVGEGGRRGADARHPRRSALVGP